MEQAVLAEEHGSVIRVREALASALEALFRDERARSDRDANREVLRRFGVRVRVRVRDDVEKVGRAVRGARERPLLPTRRADPAAGIAASRRPRRRRNRRGWRTRRASRSFPMSQLARERPRAARAGRKELRRRRVHALRHPRNAVPGVDAGCVRRGSNDTLRAKDGDARRRGTRPRRSAPEIRARRAVFATLTAIRRGGGVGSGAGGR